jgi:hypothetical protein
LDLRSLRCPALQRERGAQMGGLSRLPAPPGAARAGGDPERAGRPGRGSPFRGSERRRPETVHALGSARLGHPSEICAPSPIVILVALGSRKSLNTLARGPTTLASSRALR